MLTVSRAAKPDGQITVAVGRFGCLISQGLHRVLGDDPGLRLVDADLDHAALEGVIARREAQVVILDEDCGAIPSVSKRLCGAPGVGLLVLAHRPTREYAVRLLGFGISACLSTDAPAVEILRAVRLAAEGRHVLVFTSPRPSRAGRPAGFMSLTFRERAVLELLSSGQRNAEIALALGVSVETVRVHAKHIYRKLGVRSRGQLLDIELPSRPGIEPDGSLSRQLEARPTNRSEVSFP
jgi:DNA-binding NarL/FixJ family response regulator